MRVLVLTTALAMSIAGGALAQDAAAPPPEPGPAMQGKGLNAPPPVAGPGEFQAQQQPPPPPGGRRPHPRTQGDHPPPPSKGAHFRFEMGDRVIDVKCADDEPIKACSDATLQLLNSLAGGLRP